MKMISDVMYEYFKPKDNSLKRSALILKEQCNPIVPVRSTWVVHQQPERFYREFIFSNKAQVLAFLTEVLRHESETNHEGTQRIDNLKVSVEVYTHDVNKITELDQEYAKNIGFIYEDILSFGI